MEPILGAGGVIPPHPTFMPGVAAICRKHGILLIADEVITAFGRTGAWTGSRGWGVKPDFACTAKAITNGYFPFGAVMIAESVAEVFEKDETGKAAIGHGYTYSGHPVGAAAAIACLAETKRLNVPVNAAARGSSCGTGSLRLQSQIPGHRRCARRPRADAAPSNLSPDRTKKPADKAQPGQGAGRGLPVRRDGPRLRPEHHPLAALGDHRSRRRHHPSALDAGSGGASHDHRLHAFDERTLWHTTGEAALFLKPGGWIQPPAAGRPCRKPGNQAPLQEPARRLRPVPPSRRGNRPRGERRGPEPHPSRQLSDGIQTSLRRRRRLLGEESPFRPGLLRHRRPLRRPCDPRDGPGPDRPMAERLFPLAPARPPLPARLSMGFCLWPTSPSPSRR
jgi:hypothetical protein